MERLSTVIRRFYEDPVGVRLDLAPAVLVWREAPVTTSHELIWQTQPKIQLGHTPHDPALFPIRKRSDRQNAFALGITLGRATNNDLCVDHASVSRFHAYLQLEASGQIMVYDAESSNGTSCDGLPLPKGKGAVLRDGAFVSVGDVKLEFFLPATFEAVWLSTARR